MRTGHKELEIRMTSDFSTETLRSRIIKPFKILKENKLFFEKERGCKGEGQREGEENLKKVPHSAQSLTRGLYAGLELKTMTS